MGAGGVLILVGVILVLGVIAFVLASNAGWIGARGSDPKRRGGAEERPRHTAVNLEQDLEDEPRGEPVDRRP